jgi:predicted polyphosphate/ATP-dependent NAD kinase
MSEKKDLPDNITVKIDSLEMENVKRVPYETDDETIRRWRDGVEREWYGR